MAGVDAHRPMPGAPEALSWASTVRAVRDSVCEQLGAGTATLEEVMDARTDPRVGDAHLLVVLESLPEASKVATRRTLADLGVDGRTRLVDLRDGEVAAVLVAFGGVRAGDAGDSTQ